MSGFESGPITRCSCSANSLLQSPPWAPVSYSAINSVWTRTPQPFVSRGGAKEKSGCSHHPAGGPTGSGVAEGSGPRWGGIREEHGQVGRPRMGTQTRGVCAGGGRGNSLSVVSQKLLSQEQAGLLVSGREGRYFRGVFSDFGMLLICYMKKAGHNESYSLVNMYILIIYNRTNARMKTVSVILSLTGGVYK